MQQSSDVLAGRYANAQLTVDRADGPHLFDAQGTRYIDFILGNLTQLMGHRAVTVEAELRQERLQRSTQHALSVHADPVSKCACWCAHD